MGAQFPDLPCLANYDVGQSARIFILHQFFDRETILVSRVEFQISLRAHDSGNVDLCFAPRTQRESRIAFSLMMEKVVSDRVDM